MGSPAVIQFCQPDGTICAQLYAHYDGALVPERLREFENIVKLNGRGMHDNPSRWAAGYAVWRFDMARAEYGTDLFEALSHTPQPDMRECDAGSYYCVIVNNGSLTIIPESSK